MAETDSRILEYLEEGLFLYGVGKVQESIVRWRKVLELDPKNERAMDYIESAGGDVSQFRAKAGLPPKSGMASPGGTAPVPPPDAPPPGPPPVAAAAPPTPAMPVPPSTTSATVPLDPAVLFDGSLGLDSAPPGVPELGPRRPTPGGMGAVMPWQAAPASATQTVTSTAPSAPAMPAGGPVGTASASSNATATATVTSPSPPPAAAPSGPPPAGADPRQELINQAGALYQGRHFEQSLELLERIAREYPPVDDGLRGYMDAARNGLYEILKAQWPRPDLVPEIRMNASQVMQLKLSPEAGFIFSRVDGVSTVEEILAMGGLDPFTTLRALSQLVRAGVIGVQG